MSPNIGGKDRFTPSATRRQPDMGAAARVATGVLADASDLVNENPKLVQVNVGDNVVSGLQYVRSSVECSKMAMTTMPKGYESITPKPYNRIIVIFKDGSCPIHLIVINPDAPNDERQYCFTSKDMQDSKIGGTGVLSISPENIIKMVISPGEKLVIIGSDGNALQSEGLVECIICIINPKRSLDPKLVKPESVIQTW